MLFNRQLLRGKDTSNWKGGRTKAEGYIYIYMPGHHRGWQCYAPEHVIIAEKAMGSPLPKGALVHHVNEVRDDNRNENLVVCENQSYHSRLHARARVVRRGGNPNTEKICVRCDQVKTRSEFHKNPHFRLDGLETRCKECLRQYDRARWARKRNIK